jgi:hypothetical protein
LSQFDLKGLLTELYYNPKGIAVTLNKPASPADIWQACRWCLRRGIAEPSAPAAFAADFDHGSGVGQVDWYAVYGYRVRYNLSMDQKAYGSLRLSYEGRYDMGDMPLQSVCCPETSVYRFEDVEFWPGGELKLGSGTWTDSAGPEWAFLPTSRDTADTLDNPKLDTIDIRRVIWSAPGSMDTKESGCSMRPEVRNESGEETAEELYA